MLWFYFLFGRQVSRSKMLGDQKNTVFRFDSAALICTLPLLVASMKCESCGTLAASWLNKCILAMLQLTPFIPSDLRAFVYHQRTSTSTDLRHSACMQNFRLVGAGTLIIEFSMRHCQSDCVRAIPPNCSDLQFDSKIYIL